mgnify:FL=1
MNIDELTKRFNLARNSYVAKEEKDGIVPNKNYSVGSFLDAKWSHIVPEGWYGFALSPQDPLVFYIVVDVLTEYLNSKIEDFEVHQVKIKFGGLRYYTNVTEEYYPLVQEIEALLHDDELIY